MGNPNPRTPDVIDLEPITAADGSEVWVTPGEVAATSPDAARDGLQVSAGTLRDDQRGQPLTTLPREVLAGGQDWNRIVGAIADAERGEASDVEVAVKPGGQMEVVRAGSTHQPLSTVPREILAAGDRASVVDLAEALTHDPQDVEGWRFVDDPKIPGLRFHLAPAGRRFVFFCVRSPLHGGRWLLTVLAPNLDQLMGHEHHMITKQVGGERIPVVCGPGDSTYSSLAVVRGVATKFALYHTLRVHGHVAFSA